MSRINRRQFLLGGAAALASAALPIFDKVSFAQDSDARQNLLIVFVGGGWDTTVSMDPKPGLSTIDVPPGDVRGFGNLDIWTDASRPNVATYFDDFGDVTAVVRGIEVRSIAHEECTKRILTGTNSDGNPDMGAIAGVENGEDVAVPYMVLGNTAFAGSLGGSTGRAGLAGQFITLLHPDAAYSNTFGSQGLADLKRFKPDTEEEDLIQHYLLARAKGSKAIKGASGLNKQRIDDFITSVERRHKLRPLLNSLDDFTSQLEFAPQVDLAVKLFKDGLSRAALIEFDGEWDTHAENFAQQGYHHDRLYGGLHTLVQRLMREGLFESTVVVVISEMSRTPKLNEANGKDHWPVTSALVIGDQVAGGRAYGGTDDNFNAVPTNMQSGDPDTNGTNITSAHFASGVLELAGVESSKWFPEIDPLVALKG